MASSIYQAGFTPDPRSIYFKTLNTEGDTFDEARQAGDISQINARAGSLLGGDNGAKYKQETMGKIQKALSVLKEGISTERQNEKDYFKKILGNNKLDAKLVAELNIRFNDIMSSNNFDYMKFIDLINELLQGADEYKMILKLERKRLDDLQVAYNNVFNEAKKDKKIKRKLFKQDRSDEQFKQYLKNAYLKDPTQRRYNDLFEGISGTVDTLVAEKINKIIQELMGKEETLKLLISNFNANNARTLNISETRTQLVNNVMATLENNSFVKEIIQEKLQPIVTESKDMIDKVLDNMTQAALQRYDIEGQTDTFGSTDLFTVETNEKTGKTNFHLLQGAKKLKDNKNAFSNESNKDNIFYKSLIEGDQPLDKLLKKLDDAEKEYSKSLSNKAQDSQIKAAKREIAKAKLRVTNFMRQQIDLAAKNAVNQTYEQGLQRIRQELNSLTFEIEGWEYAEIIALVQEKIRTNLTIMGWSGPTNFKADSIRFMCDDIALSGDQYPALKEMASKITNFSEQELYQQFVNHINTNIQQRFKSTNFAYARDEFFNSYQQLFDEMRKRLNIGEDNQKGIDELKTYLKNNIVVTETVKSYNRYNNEVGFKSGSIGKGLTDRLNNLQQLFEQAGVGMSPAERDWLEVAIVNCSPFAIGSENKGPIENYLSLMAGFAVFDEGAAEIQMIAEKAKEEVAKQNSSFGPRIMHIYRLNGIYFPGSYILERMYERLEHDLLQMEDEIDNPEQGGVKIIARGNPSLINKEIQDPYARWADTYEKSKAQTTIEITFLSGLLNIVNQLGNIDTI